jgi:uncharacterized protein (UPF0332 family)
VSDYKPDYIEYRLSKALESLQDAKLLAENNSWNACINRLYYSCFYAVTALLLKNDISTNTHNGAITQFNLHFIKTSIIEKEFGKLYAKLMDWRQKGDYGDLFDFNRETVEPLLQPVEEFLNKITVLVK